MSQEKWVPVIGFENRYEVSSLGRIRFLTGGMKSQFLKTGKKYLAVAIHKNGKSRNILVHRIVYCSFHGLPLEHSYKNKRGTVRHLNDVPTDNRLENLEIGTRSENFFDWVRNKNAIPSPTGLYRVEKVNH